MYVYNQSYFNYSAGVLGILALAVLFTALLMVLVLNIPVLASIFKLTQLDGVHIAIVAGCRRSFSCSMTCSPPRCW